MNHLARKFHQLADAALLLGLSGFVLGLWSSDLYWYFLHPRFKPLTLSAGVILLGMGFFALIKPPRPMLPRSLALALALLASLLALVYVDDNLAPPMDQRGERGGGRAEGTIARVLRGDREYVRINTGELYDIAANTETALLERSYVVRGMVRRIPELDALGRFMVVRSAIFCCFADMTGVGFVVAAPGGRLPEDKSWVEVYGRLTPLPAGTKNPEPSLDGIPLASIQPDFLYVADAVEPIPMPAEPFMYEWREAEPYAY